MRKFLFLISLLTVLSSSLSGSSAYSPPDSQLTPITVSTDKREYSEGDTITISGSVRSLVTNSPLTLQIFDNQMNLVHVEQVDLSKDGTFVIPFKAGGDLWKNFGTYKVKAQYGFNHLVAQASFDLVDTVIPSKQTFHLSVGDQSYAVPYTINGGSVNDMKVDFPSLALILSINATKNGYITLDLPRDFIDAKKMDGSDEKFITLINGSEADPSEPQGITSYRNVTVNFLKEDSQIELIGTQIVPEFPLTIPILLIGFVSFLAFQRIRTN